MEITIAGAGRIGGNVARQLARAGHALTLTFARDADAQRALAQDIGARVAAPADAVASAEVVVVAVPWSFLEDALAQLGPLAGRIVIDTTNQFGSGPMPAAGQTAAAFNAARMPGARYTKSFNTLTAAFQVQTAAAFNAARMPGARYTKSFNTLTAAFQAATAGREPRVVQWLCGDDEAAKAVVAGLIRDAGYEPVDLGGTADCTVMEAPRRDGAVYGEEYRPAEAQAVVDAVRNGAPIPPTPRYG